MKPAALKAFRHAEHIACDQCPHNDPDPQNCDCTTDACIERYFELAYEMGCNDILDILKMPKTLAENRD